MWSSSLFLSDQVAGTVLGVTLQVFVQGQNIVSEKTSPNREGFSSRKSKPEL